MGGSDHSCDIEDARRVGVVSASAWMLPFAVSLQREPQVTQPAGDTPLSTGRSLTTFASNLLDEEPENSPDGVSRLLPSAEAGILVEDSSDGCARLTLTLPWWSAIEVLDLLQRHGLRHALNA